MEHDAKGVRATDEQYVLELFAARDERAVSMLETEYGGACRQIAAQILGNEQDAQEVVNDALLRLWNAIPPTQPDDLFKYLCAVVRNLAYQRLRNGRTQKRGGGQTVLSLDDEAVVQRAAAETPESLLDYSLTVEAVNRFLRRLPKEARVIFYMHYGKGYTVREIAEMYHLTQSKVLMSLLRTRNRLRQWLKKEAW